MKNHVKLACMLLILAFGIFTFVGCQAITTTKDQPKMAANNEQSIDSVGTISEVSSDIVSDTSSDITNGLTDNSNKSDNSSDKPSQVTPSKTDTTTSSQTSTDNTSAVMAKIKQRYIDEETDKHTANLKSINEQLSTEHQDILNKIENHVPPQSESSNAPKPIDYELDHLKIELNTNERNQVLWVQTENDRHQTRLNEINKIYE